MLSSILIIYTGGTIGMKTDPATGVLVPFDFRGIYDEFPAIRSLQVRIDVQSLTPVIDSSNVTRRCGSIWRSSSATTTRATTDSSSCTAPIRCPTPLRR